MFILNCTKNKNKTAYYQNEIMKIITKVSITLLIFVSVM